MRNDIGDHHAQRRPEHRLVVEQAVQRDAVVGRQDDAGEFERVGNFKEVMNWTQYLGFLSNWAPSSSWEASFKRVSEVDGVVFLELEERSEVGEFTSVVNSLSVYEFADDGKISHIDLYLQMALPNMEMLDSYQGVAISE
ncbi:hypothetical protein [Mycolicibacter sinensis]